MLKLIYPKMVTCFFAFIVTGVAHAQVELLIKPSAEEIRVLADVFERSGKIVPVPFIYDAVTHKLLAWGIPISTTVRNGVHARLTVQAGLANNIAEAKSGQKFMAGTLFLELVDGRPQLGYHPVNSISSAINNEQYQRTPQPTLQELANTMQAAIDKPTVKLAKEIFDSNARRYNKYVADFREEVPPELRLAGRVNPDTSAGNTNTQTRDRELSAIRTMWGGGAPCDDLGNGALMDVGI